VGIPVGKVHMTIKNMFKKLEFRIRDVKYIKITYFTIAGRGHYFAFFRDVVSSTCKGTSSGFTLFKHPKKN
jgi:hypothetical protein